MLAVEERSELLLLLNEIVSDVPEHLASPSFSAHSSAALDAATTRRKEREASAKPKKRVRRERLELDRLREESAELEMEVAQLQLRLGATDRWNKPGGHSTRLALTTAEKAKALRRMKPSSATSTATKGRFVWQDIAERQFQDRCRAEQENRELREALEAERSLLSRMELLLQRRIRQEQLVVGDVPKYARGLPFKTEADIFRDQLLATETALLQMEKVLQTPVFADASASFSDFSVHDDPNSAAGVAFLIHSNGVIPFGVPTIENVLWGILTSDAIRHHCYSHRIAQKTNDIVAQTFGMHYKSEVLDVDVRGQYTFRRFRDGNRVVIVWRALLELLELNGACLHGLRCHQTGWVELQPQQRRSLEGSRGTLLRSYSRMTIEQHASVSGQDGLVSMLKGLAQQSHDMLTSTFLSLTEKLFVREDWKLNGGIHGGLVP